MTPPTSLFPASFEESPTELTARGEVSLPLARTLTLTPGGQAQFRFPFEQELIDDLKQTVSGVTWNGTLRAFTVRVRAANIRAITAFARAHGFAGASAAATAQERLFSAVRETISASRAEDAEFTPPATLRGTLLPFQRAGVAYAVAARRCLIADEMGLGKTVEAIATLESLGAFPAVIVAPAGLLLNWEQELAAWLPHRALMIAGLPDTLDRTPDIILISYDLLPDHVTGLRTLDLRGVVFDEGHLLKTHDSQRTLAAKELRRGVDVRLLLTGTPVLNRAAELLAPLCILGRLDDLGGFEHFRERYCGPQDVERRQRGAVEKIIVRDYTGSSNLAELAARLRATCMVRRRKRDVLPELPPKRLARLPVDLPASVREEYDIAQRDVLDWIAARAGRDPEFRALLHGLDAEAKITAVLHRAQHAADRAAQAEELVRLNALRQIAARGKLDAAQEWIGNFLASGEKLVVFAWHRETLAALASAFPGTPIIDGDTPASSRQAAVARFQSDRAMPLIFANLQAGGVGLTLTAASNVLVLELPWTPALLDQAIDRVHRIGQRSSVTAWLMLGRRTIDYPLWKMLQKKRQTTEGATR